MSPSSAATTSMSSSKTSRKSKLSRLLHSVFGKPKEGDNGLTGRRSERIVRIWDRSFLKTNQMFRTADGTRYAVHESGAFVRTDKDRRTPKERKAARRAMREAVSQ